MSQPVIDRFNYHATNSGKVFNLPSRLVHQRLESIRHHVDFRGKTVLDLGCSGGYFSFNVAPVAKRVVGVDGDRDVIEQNVALASQKCIDNIIFLNASLTQQFIAALPEFDIVLFLSVFHHMLTASDAYDWNSEASRNEAFNTLLVIRRKARVLVFEMGYPDEGYDWSPKLPPMEPDPVTWIINNVFGNEFSVHVVPPPALEGPLGFVRNSLLNYRELSGIWWRILRRFFHVDVRDRRHLFIGVKQGYIYHA